MKLLLTAGVGISLGVALLGAISGPSEPQAKSTAPEIQVASTEFNGSSDHRARCVRTVKNQLKDPGSFKRLDHSQFRQTGILRYTATNSFGGRVQDFFDCNALTY